MLWVYIYGSPKWFCTKVRECYALGERLELGGLPYCSHNIITYNKAYESTTYEKRNVTKRNKTPFFITFVRCGYRRTGNWSSWCLPPLRSVTFSTALRSGYRRTGNWSSQKFWETKNITKPKRNKTNLTMLDCADAKKPAQGGLWIRG